MLSHDDSISLYSNEQKQCKSGVDIGSISDIGSNLGTGSDFDSDSDTDAYSDPDPHPDPDPGSELVSEKSEIIANINVKVIKLGDGRITVTSSHDGTGNNLNAIATELKHEQKRKNSEL